MWKKLNHILVEKGMTKKELAKKANISPNTIQNIRNERISFQNMVKIADALDVSLDEFRKGNNDHKTNCKLAKEKSPAQSTDSR
ncbi:TPA: helix-turn-helix transcriptional regulator [Streptococcus suis]|nr:helix-turn-helix transcriptional regulator [Streptococcus suis]HEM3700352.1 helix-turn-helix transcriptional regulator [Streptococcus suis]